MILVSTRLAVSTLGLAVLAGPALPHLRAAVLAPSAPAAGS